VDFGGFEHEIIRLSTVRFLSGASLECRCRRQAETGEIKFVLAGLNYQAASGIIRIVTAVRRRRFAVPPIGRGAHARRAELHHSIITLKVAKPEAVHAEFFVYQVYPAGTLVFEQ